MRDSTDGTNENANPKTMTLDGAETFLGELRTHAQRSAEAHFASFRDDDDQLARGPMLNDGFNDFLREKGMNWMDFEREDKLFARYCSDEYRWTEGYAYRRILVRRFREALQ